MKETNTVELREHELKICLIGTYPPRECGIATFTSDLREALINTNKDIHSSVIALINTSEEYQYPQEVVFEIRQNQLSDYRLAAEYINFSGADVVCVQHEFGIFGGTAGSYILELLKRLKKPVATTLHTVLDHPQSIYLDSMIKLADVSDHLIVLNSKAIPILKNSYGISENKISVIHHGVPDVSFVDPNYYKDQFGVGGRFVLLTFGLLSRNKGIELALEALPAVVRRYPEIVYIVLGATHPEVKRRDGEEYRLWLQRRVRELGLEEHVIFHDRYVTQEKLCEFIGACDIYITPYQSREQIVSGTLAYAIGAGKATVSTPYLHAEELLSDGRGRLVDFGDATGLAQTLIELIDKQAERHLMRKRAYEYGRQMTWPAVGQKYVDLFERITCKYRQISPVRWQEPRTISLPEIKLDHLVRLTDDTGIIQHATYGVPDRRYGYSTDDQARALVAVLRYYQQVEDETAVSMASRYLSFLQYAQLPDGDFHNFMDYTRRFIDERGSEDTLGRALWGLGTAIAFGPTQGMRALAREMFERSLNELELKHPRAIAYAICGLHAFLQRYDGAVSVRHKLIDLADQLARLYQNQPESESEDKPEGKLKDQAEGEIDSQSAIDKPQLSYWKWFGDEITYANAKMPEAMLLAYQVTGNERYKTIGLESLDFLNSETYRNGYFDFVGNKGWYRRGSERAIFGQQTIEAGYTVEACILAYEITGEAHYQQLAQSAVEWLFGKNRLGAPLYDFSTGACADGFDPQGISLNQGAETIICCLLGLLTFSRHGEKKLGGRSAAVVAAK